MMDKELSLLLYGNAFTLEGPSVPTVVVVDPRHVKIDIPKGRYWMRYEMRTEGARHA